MHFQLPKFDSDKRILLNVRFYLFSTGLLDNTPKSPGLPFIEGSTYDVKIVYIGKTLTYDITVARRVY